MKWWMWAILLGGGLYLLTRKSSAASAASGAYPQTSTVDVRIDFIEADIRASYDNLTALTKSYDSTTGKVTFTYTFKANGGETKTNREQYAVHPSLPTVHPMIKGLV